MVSDKSLGAVGLVLSLGGLLYLFCHLILFPLLPLDEDTNIFKFGNPVKLLLGCAMSGLVFIGSMGVYTFVIMWRSSRGTLHLD